MLFVHATLTAVCRLVRAVDAVSSTVTVAGFRDTHAETALELVFGART